MLPHRAAIPVEDVHRRRRGGGDGHDLRLAVTVQVVDDQLPGPRGAGRLANRQRPLMPNLATITRQQGQVPGDAQHHQFRLTIPIHVAPLHQSHLALKGLSPGIVLALQGIHSPATEEAGHNFRLPVSVYIAGPDAYNRLETTDAIP